MGYGAADRRRSTEGIDNSIFRVLSQARSIHSVRTVTKVSTAISPPRLNSPWISAHRILLCSGHFQSDSIASVVVPYSAFLSLDFLCFNSRLSGPWSASGR